MFFFVDAIQSLGVFPLDVQQVPVDALAADGHKWLLGPEGAGIAYIRREWVDRLHATGVGWNSVVHAADFSTIELNLKPHAGRWEGGTRQRRRPSPALGESLQLLLDTGIENVRARVLELTDYLCDRAPVGRGRGVQQPDAGRGVGDRVAADAGPGPEGADAAVQGGRGGGERPGRAVAGQPARV